ncbi:MAG: hypothetical protein HY921_06785 [Elusimicrobia bacterium]|nr:hypothetical protein [Elusimicrobiota bacterium]
MAPKIAFVYYSQSGRTRKALEAFARAWQDGWEVRWLPIRTSQEYPFPWKFFDFLDVFPACLLKQPPAASLEEPSLLQEADLVVLGFQPWHLAPSLPVQGFLKGRDGGLLRGKRVFTVATCRKMWFCAHQTVLGELRRLGANPIGHAALCDNAAIARSFLGTFRWLLTGEKKPQLESLEGISSHARKVRESLESGRLGNLDLYRLGCRSAAIEKMAQRYYHWLAESLAAFEKGTFARRIALWGLFVNIAALAFLLSLVSPIVKAAEE